MMNLNASIHKRISRRKWHWLPILSPAAQKFVLGLTNQAHFSAITKKQT
jgi:hypothetical protein